MSRQAPPASPGRGSPRRLAALRTPACLATTVAAALLAGCVSPQALVSNQEGMLAAAGFVARPANTPERRQMLATLPPDRVVQHPEGDHFSYLYADPLVCGCLYVGGPEAWSRYQQSLLNQSYANAQVEAAQINASAWNWGPWGGFGWGPGFY